MEIADREESHLPMRMMTPQKHREILKVNHRVEVLLQFLERALGDTKKYGHIVPASTQRVWSQ